MRGRITGAVLVVTLVLAVALSLSPAAAAEIEGPCQASIAGQNVAARDTGPRGEPIEVREKARVEVSMTSSPTRSSGRPWIDKGIAPRPIA